MRLRQVKVAGLIAGGAVIIGLWIFVAPVKLGGSTTYSITDGISMQPLLYKNDLALIRTQPSYHVGEVVLYQSQVLHKPVLHRIILVQNGNYFFKGDNNSFVDPGYATRGELIGELWVHVPQAGAVLGWFGVPAHAAFIAGFVAVALILTGSGTTGRKGRHRRGTSTVRQGRSAKGWLQTKLAARHVTPSTTSGQDTPHGVPSYLEGPGSTLAALGALLFLALLLLVVGFSRPSHRLGPLPRAFQQTGSFSYSAPVNAPTIVYPTGFIKTGEPIYTSIVSNINLDFGYKFISALPHNIKGTIELRAIVLSQANSWHQLIVIKPTTAFSGDSTDISSTLRVSSLYNLIDSVSAQSGIPGIDYSADLQPIIHIYGTVDNKPVKETFEPVLPFTIGQTVAMLAVPVEPAPPGATYVAPSASSELASALHPVQAGSIPHPVVNVAPIAKYDIEVPLLRLLGIVFTVLALVVAVLHDFLRRRQPTPSGEESIASQFQSLIVPVTSLPLPAGDALIEVPELERLAGLAQYLERPILYEISDSHHIYAVDDETHRYVTRLPRQAAGTNTVSPALVDDTNKQSKQAPAVLAPRHRLWRMTMARGIIGLFVLALALTLVTSFTASTNVPVSHVGHSVNARQLSQLAPAGCSSLTLNSIVTGSGNFSNSLSHVLILGTSGINDITDTGADNCVVGGGGKDKVIAPVSDICIIGPTSGSTYGNCTTKAQ